MPRMQHCCVLLLWIGGREPSCLWSKREKERERERESERERDEEDKMRERERGGVCVFEGEIS